MNHSGNSLAKKKLSKAQCSIKILFVKILFQHQFIHFYLSSFCTNFSQLKFFWTGWTVARKSKRKLNLLKIYWTQKNKLLERTTSANNLTLWLYNKQLWIIKEILWYKKAWRKKKKLISVSSGECFKFWLFSLYVFLS